MLLKPRTRARVLVDPPGDGMPGRAGGGAWSSLAQYGWGISIWGGGERERERRGEERGGGEKRAESDYHLIYLAFSLLVSSSTQR